MPFWEAIQEFPTSCGEWGWEAVHRIETLLALFRGRGWPVLYPYVSPKESFDQGRLADKVPALLRQMTTAVATDRAAIAALLAPRSANPAVAGAVAARAVADVPGNKKQPPRVS
jgi:nicotinamidase-related amidase